MPQILHFSGILRGMHVRTIVDCGVCPNEVIQGMKANRPKPHGHPEGWVWPIGGGTIASGKVFIFDFSIHPIEYCHSIVNLTLLFFQWIPRVRNICWRLDILMAPLVFGPVVHL